MQDFWKPRQSCNARKKNLHHYSEELTPSSEVCRRWYILFFQISNHIFFFTLFQGPLFVLSRCRTVKMHLCAKPWRPLLSTAHDCQAESETTPPPHPHPARLCSSLLFSYPPPPPPQQDIAQWHNRVMAVKRHVEAGQGQRCKQLENKARGRRVIWSERGERHCWLWPASRTNTITLLSFTLQDAGFLRRSNTGKDPYTGVKIREGWDQGWVICWYILSPRRNATASRDLAIPPCKISLDVSVLCGNSRS